jgi:hypothetical protein
MQERTRKEKEKKLTNGEEQFYQQKDYILVMDTSK